ncbi:kelch motif protein (macronuclear) [Tetrahymena thermophila SB210]|uniref:Kelch motif protein n=1 Tax=Tetrahymena thermophila (strain SB210) TaxID=312017 RepID=Q23F64_TETTS|nr:kelch motif protein [Tetrahymena thermophila SB210]EAR95289.2 kelch motif protein [Tetrahymena thermophila SB210]|eukprot:XP_001015534.2 kelch motif protein [Tetrahymena thermophila SB210]
MNYQYLPQPSQKLNSGQIKQFQNSQPVGSNHQNSYIQDLNQCKEHPNELITNFCSCLECLKPLCPECVTIHNQQHKQQRTYAEIETIRSVKQRCETKLLSAVNLLEQQINNCERALSVPEGSLDDNIQMLRRYRKRIDDVIDTHFKTIEEQIVQNMKELKTRITNFEPTFAKMKQVITEFQSLCQLLNSNDYVDIVQKICQMDVQHIIAKHKGEINKIASSLSYECLLPKLDDARVYYLVEELERVVSVRVADVQDQLQMNQFAQNSTQKSPQKYSPQQNISMKQSNTNYNPQQQQIYQNNNISINHSKSGQQFQSIQNDNESQRQFVSANQSQQQKYQQQQQLQNQMIQNEIFQITANDYFDKKSLRKFLHFFQNDDNKLHYIDLTELDNYDLKETAKSSNPSNLSSKRVAGIDQIYNIVTIDLKISFRIPSFHKSIATPIGELFLTGGTIPDGQMNKSGWIYQYDWQNQSLIQLSSMNHPRSSHGIAYLAGKIYVVGGYEHKHVMTKRCERFNLLTKKWEMISNLNYAATSLSLCSFNGRYLFKFGGIGEGYDNHLLSPYIERYDQLTDSWEVIDPKLSQVHKLNKIGFNFGLLSTSASIQINKTDIFVFGGYHEDNSGSNQSFILQVIDEDQNQNDEEEKGYDDQQHQYDYQGQNQMYKNEVSSQYFIKNINSKLLPNSEAFWNNVPIIFNKKVYALQNIAGENSDNCLENERKILAFNEREWKALN